MTSECEVQWCRKRTADTGAEKLVSSCLFLVCEMIEIGRVRFEMIAPLIGWERGMSGELNGGPKG